DSISEILAYVHKLEGIDGVNELLDMCEQRQHGAHPLTREDLERAAAELESVGLAKVATLVKARAASAPHKVPVCPYPEATNDAIYWYRSNGLTPPSSWGPPVPVFAR